MKRVLIVALVVLACFAAHAETDYTVERKVDYLWRHVMGSGGMDGDYPTKAWVNGKINEAKNALDVSISEVSNAVVSLADDVPAVVSGMAANGWEEDGVTYKLVVKATVPAPAETTFTLDDGVEETYNIVGALDVQKMRELGYVDGLFPQPVKTITKVNIGANVTSLGTRVFFNCDRLVSVTIPDSVTDIGDFAFLGCVRLPSLYIGSGVTTIGNGAFDGCVNLDAFSVSSDNPAYKSVSRALVTKDGETLVRGVVSSGAAVIPSGVTAIGSHAFYDRPSLTSIVIGADVSRIEYEAFQVCTNLTGATILGSDVSIKLTAFAMCSRLMRVYMAGKPTAASVQSMDGYPWGLPSGCSVVCSSGETLIVSPR